MRLVLAIAILASSAVSAHAGGDRYGPARTAVAPDAARSTALPYAGRMLGWAGKTAAPTPAAETRRPEPVRPELMRGGLYRTAPPSPAPVAMAAPARPVAAAPAPYAPQTAPQSLYSAPAPRAGAASLPPPPSATVTQGGLYASTGPRFYSVHRAYGETPDPIPATPPSASAAYRPEASLAGAVALSGVGDGVLTDGQDDSGFGGVGASDAAEEAERAAKREAERAAARRTAAGSAK
ncbi:MAG: hypothetical protein K9G59_03665 [Caulobacter sp.]|nr:hypothetical protein [Caulobacter sp.]